VKDGSRIRLLAVVGPTASGKSALALALAHRLGGEIVSCDSMQVYREMDIGTAKPTDAERAAIPHHLIDVADPREAFSCADYVAMASEAVEAIAGRGALPILCGGTGLYLDAFLRGGLSAETRVDPAVRERLLAEARECGNAALHARLAAVDPESAAATHENNVKRVIRALEIYESTGMTKTEADRLSRQWESPYDAVVIGLRYPDRSLLYDRIHARVDQMLEAGLLDETRALLGAGVFAENHTAAQAIGYKEILPYLRGEESLESAKERLVIATRHYAKRQLTWFGAKDYVYRIHMERDGEMRTLAEVADEVEGLWREHLQK
jgi:tRNA dimethylallyltransferase